MEEHSENQLDETEIEAAEEETLADVLESRPKKKKGLPDTSYPNEVFLIPLSRRPFFPGMAAPIVIEPGHYYEMLKQVAKTEHKCMGLFLTKTEDVDIYEFKPKDLYNVGVLARILRIIPMEQGGAQVVLNMERRISIKKATRVKNKYYKATVSYHDEKVKALTKELKAYSISIITTIKELFKLNPLFKEELQIFLGHSDFTEPGKLADFAVALTTANRDELQEVLETFDLHTRIDKALPCSKKSSTSANCKIASIRRSKRRSPRPSANFSSESSSRRSKKSSALKKTTRRCDLEKFEARLKERQVPDDVMNVISDEMEKLSVLEVQSAEYAVCRNYLDWLTIIPWGIYQQRVS